MVLLTSVMLVVTLLAVQAGVLFHARHIVTAAAQEGARAARVVDLDAGPAQAAGAGWTATRNGLPWRSEVNAQSAPDLARFEAARDRAADVAMGYVGRET